MPFELGRPLGVPNDREFQARVLMSCLRLLDAETGPVLEDYPEDVPPEARPSPEDMDGMVCAIELPQRPSDDSDMTRALLAEIGRMRPWYDMALNQRGRTTVGLSQLSIEDAARFLTDFIEDPAIPSQRDDIEVGALLKLVCEDLKAFYGEAFMVQPGAMQPGMSSGLAIEHWLFNETTLGHVLWTFREANTSHPDPVTRYVAQRQLIPDRQVHYKGAEVFETDNSI